MNIQIFGKSKSFDTKKAERYFKEDQVFDRPELMKAPIVRNGKQATVGYAPEVWETWK